MVEVILPPRLPRATLASNFRSHGRERESALRRRVQVPMSMLASPRRDGEGLSFATFGEAGLMGFWCCLQSLIPLAPRLILALG
eukprot:symbB.v1.2.032752.t1/scaffold3961.1/size48600/1